jgi:predicted Zn-dependent protease with MMP-like domain
MTFTVSEKTASAVGMPLPESAWISQVAPSLVEFEGMARRAFDALPETFRNLAGYVTFVVAEFPEDDVLKDLDVESPFDLLGLFHGVGLAHASAAPSTGAMPNAIWLYRRPILDYWAEHEETLGDIVSHVLIHEIGHHFGLSDEDMEAIEEAAG